MHERAPSISGSPRAETLERLARSSDDLSWIVSRVSATQETAARAPGEWSVRQVMAHILMYEERYALPTIDLMAAGRPAIGLDITGTESDLSQPSADLSAMTLRELHSRLQASEVKRTHVVENMSDEEFILARRSLWGPQSARWVVEKSIGHYWEHGVTIFYIAHFHQLATTGLLRRSRGEREAAESFG